MTLPLALLAFIAIGTPYIGSIFTPTTRWLFLLMLGVTILRSSRGWALLGRPVGIALLSYLAWCLTTCFWSIVPELSYLKFIATLFTVLSFTMGGYMWSLRKSPPPRLFYLVPVAAISLASAVTGRSAAVQEGIELYYGLTGNPNFLGMLAASSSPLIMFLLYRAFSAPSSAIWRGLTVTAAVLTCVVLWKAGSRSGVLCAACVVAVGLSVLRASKLMLLGVLAMLAVTAISTVAPQIQSQLYERLIIKYSPDGDVFYTRRDAWEDSKQGARHGGLYGLGIGASYGDTNFESGFTSVGYGREKGNTQLAVIEEEGLIGLALYAVLLVTILSELFGRLWRLPAGQAKFELALTTGLVVGLIAQSCFEAWWTSPGSAESGIFWATLGVGLGLSRNAKSVRRPVRNPSVSPTALRPALPYES